jgi:hypothetical protein
MGVSGLLVYGEKHGAGSMSSVMLFGSSASVEGVEKHRSGDFVDDLVGVETRDDVEDERERDLGGRFGEVL